MSINLRKQVTPKMIKTNFGAIKTQNFHLGGTLKSKLDGYGLTPSFSEK